MRYRRATHFIQSYWRRWYHCHRVIPERIRHNKLTQAATRIQSLWRMVSVICHVNTHGVHILTTHNRRNSVIIHLFRRFHRRRSCKEEEEWRMVEVRNRRSFQEKQGDNDDDDDGPLLVSSEE